MTPAPHYALRPARPDDAPRLAALSMLVWLDTYAPDGINDSIAGHVFETLTPAAVSGLLDEPACTFLVAESGPHLLGFAMTDTRSPCPVDAGGRRELVRLYVHPKMHGKGIGQALLRASTGPDGLWLAVWALNARALAFYARQGLSIAGETAFILDGEAHPNLVLFTAQAAR